ncbi:MAG: DnaJ family domain-containing protein [Desulfovibrionaceae bacterium]
MLRFIEQMAEEAIRKAQREGAFNDLEGAGRPLEYEDDSMIPPDLRMAYKILKNANCLPPELEARKEINTALELLAGMQDEQERYRQMQKLNLMISRLNARTGRRLDMEQHDEYYRNLLERMSAAKTRQSA